jgi:hypothetical protein
LRAGSGSILASEGLRRVTSFFVELQVKCENVGTPVTDSIVARNFGNGAGTLQVDMAVKDGSGRQVDTFSTGRLPVGWKVKLI